LPPVCELNGVFPENGVFPTAGMIATMKKKKERYITTMAIVVF
jgi:hypothetical protein